MIAERINAPQLMGDRNAAQRLLAERLRGLDTVTLGLWLSVLLVGVVGVGSASVELSYSQYGNAFGFVLRHMLFVCLAVGVAALTLMCPLQRLLQFGRLGFLVALLLLALVLFSRPINGATRWLGVRPFTVQPSEIMKVAYIIFLARHLTFVGDRVGSVRVLLSVLAMLALTALLLLKEPDFGSAVVLGATTFGVLFLGRARLAHLGVLGAFGITAMSVIILLQPYRITRLLVYADPWATQFGSGYQLTQALIAFGRGSWFGTGIGDSVQKLFYLPEAHNDFLFAVIAEETGLVGAAVVVALLLGLAARILFVASRAEARGQKFGALVGYGVGVLIGVQTMINVGVNTGLLPTKGLTLPFVSYGGNSLIISGALIGLALRVHWETTLAPEKARRGR